MIDTFASRKDDSPLEVVISVVVKARHPFLRKEKMGPILVPKMGMQARHLAIVNLKAPLIFIQKRLPSQKGNGKGVSTLATARGIESTEGKVLLKTQNSQ